MISQQCRQSLKPCKKWYSNNKQIQKSQKIFDDEGIPDFILEVLIKIRDVAEDTSIKANLNAMNNKSFNILKQKIKKYITADLL